MYTDASYLQLGAVISQDGKHIAFYSRKLTDAQKRYTTTERELRAIVGTLKKSIETYPLVGQQVTVWTDHKNLTCKNITSECVHALASTQEEYGPDIKYIQGTKKIVADAFSRL